ncbi:hypothetical protein ACSLN1_25885, partial [Escherichia coli]
LTRHASAFSLSWSSVACLLSFVPRDCLNLLPFGNVKLAYHISFIKALLRAAEREWKMLDKAPIIKVPQPKNKRIRWLEPHEA